MLVAGLNTRFNNNINMNNAEYLREVLETHRISKIEGIVAKHRERRDEISQAIRGKYGTQSYDPFQSGSFAKHTATNIKFDMDIVVPFKKLAFDTLQEMFDSVYDFLSEVYSGTGATIRKQKVSIGISFPLEQGEDKPVEVDVVPGRELNIGGYPKSRDLNLCFNEDHWGFKKGSCQKTNIQKQIEYIKGKDNEREVIRLLKIWKKQNNKDYKSFVIELAVIRALDGYNGSNDLWQRLRFVLEYLSKHIADSSFHLYDPGNSGNDVIGTMDPDKRDLLKFDVENMLRDIDDNPDLYLPRYFKVNEKYSGYQEKRGQMYPTSPQRFG